MKKKTVLILIIVSLISLIYIHNIYNKKSSVTTNGTPTNNKKIAWGLKRENNNLQPQFNKSDTDVLDKYNGIYVGNKDKKYVYLTFDEGYENGYTNQILDILKKCNVPAAFFITGDYLKTSGDIVQRIINEGHIVGNHTNSHPSIPSLNTKEKIENELKNLENKVMDKYGYQMKYFRPPMGEFSEYSLNTINNMGYTTVMWSFAYDDWNVNNQKGIKYAKDKILKNIHPGAILLLHAVSKDNANVLEEVIIEIRNMGYEFKSLEEFGK